MDDFGELHFLPDAYLASWKEYKVGRYRHLYGDDWDAELSFTSPLRLDGTRSFEIKWRDTEETTSYNLQFQPSVDAFDSKKEYDQCLILGIFSFAEVKLCRRRILHDGLHL